MKLFDKIELWHNKISDSNFVWFPFLFLKPNPETNIMGLRKVKMILCFGLYYGIYAALKTWYFNGEEFDQASLKFTFGFIIFFTFWFNFVTAPLWNRRATRIAIINK